jgi:hypothetical protein
MRGALYFLAAALVAVSAFWAYRVNYQAQEAQSRVADLRARIEREREAINVLRAEWAWLTAPDRLRQLVDANATALGLAPMSGASFMAVADAPRPAPVVWDAAPQDGSAAP